MVELIITGVAALTAAAAVIARKKKPKPEPLRLVKLRPSTIQTIRLAGEPTIDQLGTYLLDANNLGAGLGPDYGDNWELYHRRQERIKLADWLLSLKGEARENARNDLWQQLVISLQEGMNISPFTWAGTDRPADELPPWLITTSQQQRAAYLWMVFVNARSALTRKRMREADSAGGNIHDAGRAVLYETAFLYLFYLDEWVLDAVFGDDAWRIWGLRRWVADTGGAPQVRPVTSGPLGTTYQLWSRWPTTVHEQVSEGPDPHEAMLYETVVLASEGYSEEAQLAVLEGDGWKAWENLSRQQPYHTSGPEHVKATA